jgi:hypothetical protein
MDQLQMCALFAQAFWALCGGGLSLLAVTWQLFRTKRYLAEALERERLSSTARERQLIASFSKTFNTRVQSLLESFLREPTPTLHDLVERTEREFRARASERRSVESESTIQVMTRDFIPR